MMWHILALLCTFSGIIQAQLLRREHSIDLREWDWKDEAYSSQSLHVTIALAIENVDLGVETLLRISDPDSLDYGKYLSAKEVSRIFEPKPDTVLGVMEWLERSDVSPHHVRFSHGGSHLSLDLPTHKAAKLLQTTFYRQKHSETGQERITCQHYHIPQSLADNIDYVSAVSLTSTHRHARRQQVVLDKEATLPKSLPANCFEKTTIPCLRALYGIPDDIQPHPNNSFGVFETAWFSWRPEDLDMFFEKYQKNLVGQRPIVDGINGGYLQWNWSVPSFNMEPDLDFQYAMALTSPQNVTNVQVGSETIGGNLNDMLEAFDMYYCDPGNKDYRHPFLYPPGCSGTKCDCGSSVPPRVLSISWGWTESHFTPNYLHRQCLEFLKLGLMGTTVVVSISDFGTASDRGSHCINDTRFSPMYPSSCPWVTSVGGTQMFHPGTSEMLNSDVRETAWRKNISGSINSSGGGFSNVFPIPPYQVRNVASYKHIENGHLKTIQDRFNGTGRAYPDVAARANSYKIVLNKEWKLVAGTSASTPVFASIITLINSERMHAGKGPVGFINPVLYGNPEVLNDIDSGDNEGCGFDPAFRATQGWDAVTGLGSPDYKRMRDLFMSLP